MKKPLIKKPWVAWGGEQLGAGHGCKYLEKKVVVVVVVVVAAVAAASAVVRGGKLTF